MDECWEQFCYIIVSIYFINEDINATSTIGKFYESPDVLGMPQTLTN